MSTVFCPLVLAEGGNQTGATGTSGQKPLSFVSVTLASGENVQNAKDIPLQPKFTFLFDKNVVNSLIWQNNSNCFTMTASNLPDVPLIVSKVDDTINFSLRQNIYVEPKIPLQPGTTYTLTVSQYLTAKNGVALGQDVIITFTTENAQTLQGSTQPTPATPPPTPTQPTQKPITTQPSAAGKPANNSTVASEQTAGSTPQPSQAQQGTEQTPPVPKDPQLDTVSPTTSLSNGNKQASNWHPDWLLLLSGGAVVCWIGIEVFLKLRKKRIKNQ